jgi:hypothetical protein
VKQARKISFLTPTSQPTWLIEGDLQSIFDNIEKAAAKLATAATAQTPKATSMAGLLTPTLGLPPQNPYASLTSLLETSFMTLPSIPHINLSSSAHLHYPIFVPQFTKDASTCCSPPSATSCTPTDLSMNTFAEILAALLTRHTKCPTRPHLSRSTTCCHTHQMSQAPQNPQALRKSCRIQ